MGLRLFWKEKVARNFAGAILCFTISIIVKSQPLPSETITFSGESMPLEDVFRQISSATGFHFIYSSDMVDVGAKVSLSCKNQSIENVLMTLEEQVNISFKRRDRHIIVKSTFPNSKSPVPSQGVTSSPGDHIATYDYSPHTDNLATAAAQTPLDKIRPIKPDTSLSNKFIKKHLPDLLFYFDTVTIKRLPIKEIRKLNLNSRHRGWFFSTGPVFNDYSIGTELQFGIRNLYGVFVPNLLSTGDFQQEYGLGTSFLLSNNLSINPVFTYSTSERREISYVFSSTHRLRLDEVQSIRDHRTKILIQYSPTENISIRFGPVFNYSRIKSYTQINGAINRWNRGMFVAAALAIPSQRNFFQSRYAPSRERSLRLEESPIKNFSLGWELSLAFRINFFHRQ